MTVHLLHGLHVRSEVDLHLPPGPDAQPDVTLVLGPDREVSEDAPPGEVFAHLAESPTRPLYTFVQRSEGITLRFHRLCDFEIDPTLSRVTCHRAPGTDADFVSVLAGGMLATVLLVLRGHPVLHGSAVATDGRALAFVGASGMGKSTLATLLCDAGGGLVTDDVLRIDLHDSVPVCRSGAAENRLRKEEISGAAARRTADGRNAVRAARLSADRVPLAAIAVPYPRRDTPELSVEWLTQGEALLELLRFPRIVGWNETQSTARHFDFLADLVALVPVARLRVPWGPPFAPDLPSRVWAALLQGSSAATP